MVLDNKLINKLLYATTCFILICQLLINNFGLPSSIMLVLDIFIIVSGIYLIPDFWKRITYTQCKLPCLIAGILLLSSVVGAFSGYDKISWYITGLRLYGKYFVLFFVGAQVLNQRRIFKLLTLFKKIVWVNVIICTVQYFLLGYKGDFCGGIFGTGKTNSWMNVLLCIVSIYAIASYVNSQMKLKDVALICVPCVYIAALAELKFFFFELAIIVVLVIIFSKPNRKTVIAGVAGVILLLLLSQIVDTLWSAGSSDIFSLKGIQDYFAEKSYGYASVGDLGRIGGIAKLNKKFFPDTVNFFGFGLGSCGYGTTFYKNYEYLHYIWFGYLSTYLEMGWVGLIFYIAFFISVIIASRKIRKRNLIEEPTNMTIHLITECMAVLGIILLWYNTTVKNYPAYFLFLTLSFAFALNNRKSARR